MKKKINLNLPLTLSIFLHSFILYRTNIVLIDFRLLLVSFVLLESFHSYGDVTVTRGRASTTCFNDVAAGIRSPT